jgi:TonB family protein
MHGPMQPIFPPEPRPDEDDLVELPPHARLPRLDLGIDWEAPREGFGTSVREFFTGPRPPKYSEVENTPGFRVDWIRGRAPGRAFVAAVLLQVAVIWLLILPIWGFLPQITPTLAPLQVELTVYDPTDLPRIKLPANVPKPIKKPDEPAKQPPQQGADAIHPRQTIISIPVHVTHPRQTLIRPDAPPTPPKIVTPLPNIVQWSDANLRRPHLELAPTTSAPRLRHRAVADAVAPDVAKSEKNPGPIDIAPSPATIARPKIVLDAMSTSVAQRHATHADAGPAPEIGAATEESDVGLRRLIALSATPAPPAPEVSVPKGNLAARISISPEGGKPGTPGAAAHGVTASGENGGGGSTTVGTANSAGGANGSSLPAAVSISGAPRNPGNGGNAGGITPSGSRAGGLNLNLKPMTPYEPSSSTRRGPADVSKFDSSLPPEKILSGKEVYTLHVNLPNLTSASGSWIMDFAELDEEDATPYRHKELVACPVPVEKADPKYPPELIKAHVKGEVVLYAIVRKDGSVDSIQIVRGLDPQLDHNAIEALELWKFRPGTHAGAPADFEGVIYVPFSYENPRE